jgi:hypothetical protein
LPVVPQRPWPDQWRIEFTEADRRRILALVETHVDELIGWWFHFREDFKRGRLRRNPMTW